jgi:hypothetical protein
MVGHAGVFPGSPCVASRLRTAASNDERGKRERVISVSDSK